MTAKVDPEICRTCTARIFLECAGKRGPGAAVLHEPEATANPKGTLAA